MKRSVFGVLVLSLLLFLSPQNLVGADFKAGDNITISRLVGDNLYAAGGTINIDAIIDGDLLAAGGNIYINDSIKGDLISAGGNLMVNAPIGDDARLAGGMIQITRSVMGDLIIFGGELSIAKGSTIMGDLVIFGGNIKVNGTVNGNLIIKGGECLINGTINGNTDIKGEEIKLNGNFSGTDHIIAAEHIEIQQGAQFAGNIRYWQKDGEISNLPASTNGQWSFDPSLQFERSEMGEQYWGLGIALGIFAMILATLLLIVLYWALFRNAFETAGKYIYQQFLNSFGAGILYFFAFPPIALFLMVIIIGIPIGLFMLGLYAFILLTGHAIAGLALANSFKFYYQKQWKNWQIILVAFGFDILLKILLLIPFLGILITVVAVAAAVGGLIIHIWQGYRKPATF